MTKQMTNTIFDTALIFEGGGMRASYTCAVANVLLENGIFFDNVYGLSAGASNTVNYVSRDIDRTRRSFVELVEDPNFGGLDTLFQHKGYFSAEYIYQEAGMPGEFLPFDFESFCANPAKITIESFNRDTGQTVYWTKDDMPTLPDLMVRVRASSSLPLVMPPPKIGDSYYYDGGLGEGAGFLLPRAQRDGFKRFFIVRTQPKTYRKQIPHGLANSLTNTTLWGHPHVVKALKDRWWKYNAFCDEIEQLERDGNAYVFYARDMAVSSGETDFAKLEANYNAGYAQATEELPAMKAFLGL
jgi:predicted patatin/cPLA2 family phospholipase